MREGIAVIPVRSSRGRRSRAEPMNRVALVSVCVRAQIVGSAVKALVEQLFVNREDRAIEAVYTFPLPEEAAVCGFEIVTGDRVLTGKVVDREKAISDYDIAIEEGDAAFLVEQERRDVFTARLGNLKPNQAATVRLTYTMPLQIMDRAARLTFPTTVAPRYVTESGTDPLEAAIVGDALNPPHVLAVPYGLSLDVDIDLGPGLRSVTSPSHAIEQEVAESGRRRVRFADCTARMDRDVVLQLELAADPEPRAVVRSLKDGSCSFAAVTFAPTFTDDELALRKKEIVFVIDCSGSMEGESIDQAKKALELCLRQMRLEDSFNICRFGATFEFMSPKPLVYSEKTLKKAIAYVQGIEADLGGTELLPALGKLFDVPVKSVAQRQVILLTDGQISNEPAVMALCRRNRGSNRIFSFGIGTAPSASLVRGLAQSTGGAAEFVTAGEDIAEKVVRTFSRIGSPMISDVQVDWGDQRRIEAAPMEVPPIFDGETVTVHGRFVGAAPERITLKATTPTGLKTWTVAVESSETVDSAKDDALAMAWARSSIRDLEDRTSNVEDAVVGSRIAKLSQEFNLLSSRTAFIAVEHRSEAERDEGRPELRRVPIELAAGWGNIVMGASAPPRGLDMIKCAIRLGGPVQWLERKELAFGRAPMHHRRVMVPSDSSGNDVTQLLKLQGANGSFDWSDGAQRMLAQLPRGLECCQIIDGVLERLTGGRRSGSVQEVWQTLLAIVLLRSMFEHNRSLWSGAESKALAFVRTECRRVVAEELAPRLVTDGSRLWVGGVHDAVRLLSEHCMHEVQCLLDHAASVAKSK